MDALDGISNFLEHIGLRAHTFYTGPLCGLHDFSAEEEAGHLHVVHSGEVRAEQRGMKRIIINEPTLLFYPRPIDHRLHVADQVTANVLCASVHYAMGIDNAITQSLPAVVIIPYAAAPGLELTLSLLFTEAGNAYKGRKLILDRLCDVLLIQIVRHAIDHNLVASGMLVGLAHPRLGKLLVELLDAPGKNWTLDTMAAHVHLSRNAFSRIFKHVIGDSPAAFLMRIRISLAQRLLRQGHSLEFTAQETGYGSQPAFSRAFIREMGIAPSAWSRQDT